MTCEKAESYLSAYLDDILDPQLRQDVAAHVESCAHCTEVLADYRRFDALLVGVPRVAPADALREQIFGSPEFADLLRRQNGRVGGRASAPIIERPAPAEIVSSSGSASPRASRRGVSPPWPRVVLQSAAVLALLLGSALLIKQGLLHSSTTTGRGPQTIGGYGSAVPLSAGPRAVYLHGDELWSAPENGPGIAQRLTPEGVRVAGWAVSPDRRTIGYINAADGGIHVIRSDDQSDHAVGSVTGGSLPADFWTTMAGQSVAAGISWAPNGQYIAYVGADASRHTALHIMRANGSDNRAMGSAAASTGAAIWSADSTHLAFVQSDASGSQSISVYDATTHQAFQVATHADPADVSATVSHLAWLGSSSESGITWAAADNGTITGIFTQLATSSMTATRLTPTGTRYTAAAFTATHTADLWMVSSANTLSIIGVDGAGTTSATTPIEGTASQIVWSPSGATAAYLTTDGTLGLWTPGAVPVTIVAHATGSLIWSPDSSRLAATVSDGILTVRIVNGTAQALTRLASVTGYIGISWSPDGQALAIGCSSGLLIAANGHTTVSDSMAPADMVITWTIAG